VITGEACRTSRGAPGSSATRRRACEAWWPANGSENRLRVMATADGRQPWPEGSRQSGSWLGCHLTATCSESERRWTKVNLGERLRTPADGFEDRGANVHHRPSTSAQVRLITTAVHDRPPSSAVIRGLGCHLGCQRAQQAQRKQSGPEVTWHGDRRPAQVTRDRDWIFAPHTFAVLISATRSEALTTPITVSGHEATVRESHTRVSHLRGSGELRRRRAPSATKYVA
jgi:hypothetical protein